MLSSSQGGEVPVDPEDLLHPHEVRVGAGGTICHRSGIGESRLIGYCQEELHSSKDWIENITDFNAERGIRVSPYVFPDLEDADPQDDVADESDFHDASSGLITSVVRGAGALRMLSTSRFETLKALLSPVDLFGSSIKEEASTGDALY